MNCEHFNTYGKPKFRFEWCIVTHPGVWACGGGRQDLPPVLIGVTLQVPQSEPEFAWWCYIGPRPEFENEFDPYDEDKKYFEQCQAVPRRITKNMMSVRPLPWTCGECGKKAVQNLRKYEGDSVIGTCDNCGTEWVS